MNKIFTFLLVFISFNLFGQPGTVDKNFNTLDPGFSNGEGPDVQVFAVAIQKADDKVIIGGSFTTFNEKTINRIARIDNGFLDSTFKVSSGFNNYVQCIAIQNDGKILVGGNFTSYNGTTRNKIARLNADGTLDLTFNPGNGFNNLVRCIIIQNDGKIVVGGNFTNFNGTSRNRIARLNSNGTLDNTYNPGTGFNGIVYALAIQSNDKVLAVGGFTLFNGAIRERVARLKTNGTLDTSFDPGFGFDNTVYSLAYSAKGKIVAVGDFGYFNGTVRNKIALLDSSGGLITSFNPKGGFNSGVYSANFGSDGKIIAGGSFTTYNNTSINKIARLDTSGILDSTFRTGTGFSNAGGATVYSMALHADGRIVAVGNFSTYDGKARNNIARIFADGKIDLSLNMFTGFNATVRAIAWQKDGKIIAVGDFKFFNGVERSGIARLNTDGTLDTNFNIGSGINYNQFYAGVYSVAIQRDGKILVGGDFFGYNGKNVGNLIRLLSNGTLDTTFNAGNGAGAGIIRSIVLQQDGKIIIGGSFISYNGTFTNKIARINTDGTRDITFNTGSGFKSGFDNVVMALAIQDDGKILVGGGFSSYKDTFFNNRIVRLNTNGSLDAGFNYKTGFNAGINAIAIQDDGKILVGGSFTNFNSVSRLRIARIKKDGSLDSTFYPGSSGFSGIVNTILVQGDQKIIVGGEFTNYNLVKQNRIARLNTDGTPDNSIDFGNGFSNSIETITIQSDGKILAGGSFTAFNNYGRNRIARLNNNCIKNLITINPTVCKSYSFDGKTYSTSGVYTYSFTNYYGCDSIITINLTINQDVDTTISKFACDSFIFNGQNYKTSGVFYQTLKSHTGCDSNITLNLTIRKSSNSTITATACGSYIFNGKTYTNSGSYKQMFTNAAGCDSTVTLKLKINKIVDSTITAVACDSFIWNAKTYTKSGNYKQNFISVSGCDSNITLKLTINIVDTSISRSGNNSLTANATGAIYQWLDCDNTSNPEIQGEINRSFIAAKAGKYAVRVTQNNCTATSSCYELSGPTSGIDNNTEKINITFYPNPANNSVTIHSTKALDGAVIKVYSLTGQLISETYKVSGNSWTLEINNYTPGLYFVEIYQEGKVVERLKLVKI